MHRRAIPTQMLIPAGTITMPINSQLISKEKVSPTLQAMPLLVTLAILRLRVTLAPLVLVLATTILQVHHLVTLQLTPLPRAAMCLRLAMLILQLFIRQHLVLLLILLPVFMVILLRCQVLTILTNHCLVLILAQALLLTQTLLLHPILGLIPVLSRMTVAPLIRPPNHTMHPVIVEPTVELTPVPPAALTAVVLVHLVLTTVLPRDTLGLPAPIQVLQTPILHLPAHTTRVLIPVILLHTVLLQVHHTQVLHVLIGTRIPIQVPTHTENHLIRLRQPLRIQVLPVRHRILVIQAISNTRRSQVHLDLTQAVQFHTETAIPIPAILHHIRRHGILILQDIHLVHNRSILQLIIGHLSREMATDFKQITNTCGVGSINLLIQVPKIIINNLEVGPLTIPTDLQTLDTPAEVGIPIQNPQGITTCH